MTKPKPPIILTALYFSMIHVSIICPIDLEAWQQAMPCNSTDGPKKELIHN